MTKKISKQKKRLINFQKKPLLRNILIEIIAQKMQKFK